MIVDPEGDAVEAKKLYGVEFHTMSAVKNMDAVLMVVKHEEFEKFMPEKIAKFYDAKYIMKVIVDLKGCIKKMILLLRRGIIGCFKLFTFVSSIMVVLKTKY